MSYLWTQLSGIQFRNIKSSNPENTFHLFLPRPSPFEIPPIPTVPGSELCPLLPTQISWEHHSDGSLSMDWGRKQQCWESETYWTAPEQGVQRLSFSKGGLSRMTTENSNINLSLLSYSAYGEALQPQLELQLFKFFPSCLISKDTS